MHIEKYAHKNGNLLISDPAFQEACHAATKAKLEELGLENTEDNYNYCQQYVCDTYDISFAMPIGEHIKDTRKALKLTQKQLADAYGCTNRYISQIEKSDVDVTTSTMQRLAHAFSIASGKKVVSKTFFKIVQK